VSSGNLRFEALQPIHREKLAELFERFRYSKIDQYFHPHPLTTEEAINKCSNRGADYYCLVFDGTNPVGYGMLRGWDEGYTEPSLGMAIDASMQGRGIGKLLMGHLHGIAQSRGSQTVRLKVYTDNLNAIKLYQLIGYSFENVGGSELLGKIKLGPAIKRIAINTQGFVDWAGGTDFLFNVISALLATPLSSQTEFYILIPKLAPRFATKAWFKYIEVFFRGKLRGQDQHAMRNQHIQSLEQRLKEFGPRLNLISLRLDSKSQEQVIKDLKIDAIIPLMRVSTIKVECGVVGYIYDFQHIHFPQFFSKRAIARRNKLFHEMLTQAKVVIVNAQSVAQDIQKHFSGTPAQVIALPFAPSPQPDWLIDKRYILKKYGINGKYFIICNQLWEHKNHLTAFKAFAEFTAKHSDVELICTGSPIDSRNPNFLGELKKCLTELKIENKVKILGHIPKRDQIELLKHSNAVIQPTLFEGGPGGGSVYESVALDVPSIVSDIPVNKEIGSGRITFFPAKNHQQLAVIMAMHIDATHTQKTPQELEEDGQQRIRYCGAVLWQAIEASLKN
jgi:glycosyltransferase involved in cell wall biosynthesis